MGGTGGEQETEPATGQAGLTTGLTLGIDIGGTAVKAALLEGGDVHATSIGPVHHRPSREELIRSVRAAVDGLGLGRRSVSRVGLAVPGIRDTDGFRVERALNLLGLEGLDLRDLVRDTVGPVARISVDTDAAASAFGWWCQQRPAGRTMAFVIGTGVGAAAIDDGELVRLTARGIGHWGQIEVGPMPGAAGDRGSETRTLESMIGAPALMARADDLGEFGPDHPGVLALARVMRIAMVVMKPDRFVLLGGVGERLDAVTEQLGRLVAGGREVAVAPRPEILVGAGRHHGAVGAARLSLRLDAAQRVGEHATDCRVQ